MIEKILSYMQKGKRKIRISTVCSSDGKPFNPENPDTLYETMIFEGNSLNLVGACGGYSERGPLATSLHSAAINRYWGKGFRTLSTVAIAK